MALFAITVPILEGKFDQFQQLLTELQTTRYEEFRRSREALGVHERSFVQQTPMGSFVIVTLEGDDPAGAFIRFGQRDDEFTTWFKQAVREIHGLDLSAPPPGPLPQLVIDSQSRDVIDLSEQQTTSTAQT